MGGILWCSLLEINILVKRSVFYKYLCEYGGKKKKKRNIRQVIDKCKIQHEVLSFYLMAILNIKANMSHLLDHRAEGNIQYAKANKILWYVKMYIESIWFTKGFFLLFACSEFHS